MDRSSCSTYSDVSSTRPAIGILGLMVALRLTCRRCCLETAGDGNPGPENAHRFPIGDAMDFDLSPLLVVWEVTQACDLACVHCRPSELPDRDPGELSTEEA